MLGTVAGNHLIIAGITTQWEADFDDVIATLHQHDDS